MSQENLQPQEQPEETGSEPAPEELTDADVDQVSGGLNFANPTEYRFSKFVTPIDQKVIGSFDGKIIGQ